MLSGGTEGDWQSPEGHAEPSLRLQLGWPRVPGPAKRLSVSRDCQQCLAHRVSLACFHSSPQAQDNGVTPERGAANAQHGGKSSAACPGLGRASSCPDVAARCTTVTCVPGTFLRLVAMPSAFQLKPPPFPLLPCPHLAGQQDAVLGTLPSLGPVPGPRDPTSEPNSSAAPRGDFIPRCLMAREGKPSLRFSHGRTPGETEALTCPELN